MIMFSRADKVDMVSIQLAEDAANKDYATVKKRLDTFTTWNNANQNPTEIAEAGFFSCSDDDRVRCFFCNGGLCNWERTDVPWYEHRKWFGNCKFLKNCMAIPEVNAIIETVSQMSQTNSHHHHHHGTGRTQCD